MNATYQEIMYYLEGDSYSLVHTLRSIISDYFDRIRNLPGEEMCWEERVLATVDDRLRSDISPQRLWFTPEGYSYLDIQACCQVIYYSNIFKDGKSWNKSKNIPDEHNFSKMYGIKKNDSIIMNRHLVPTPDKTTYIGCVRGARNFLDHPKKINLTEPASTKDLGNFVDGMKEFLTCLPRDKIEGLKDSVSRLLFELHDLWESLPELERKNENWEVTDLLPELTKKNIVQKISNHNKSESQPKEPKPFVPTQTHGIDDTKTRPQPKSPMRVNRENPQLILFLVDESKSMAEYLENQNGKPVTRGEVVVQKMTQALFDMVEDCQVDGEDKNYYYVSLLGYCGSDNSKPEDLYDYAADADAELKNAAIRPLLMMNDFRVGEDKWMKYSPLGRTPMKPAFERAFELIKEWDNLKENYSEEELEKIPKKRLKEVLATSQLISEENNSMWKFREMNRGRCHPPIIINISDGRFDNQMYGEKPDLAFSPEKIIQKMKNHQYKNFSEPPVVMNLYISGGDDKQTLEFPDKRPSGDDEYLKHMFDLSSTLSQNMLTCAREYPKYSQLPNSARALIYNADSVGLETILRIGTIGTRMGITETVETRDDPGY